MQDNRPLWCSRLREPKTNPTKMATFRKYANAALNGRYGTREQRNTISPSAAAFWRGYDGQPLPPGAQAADQAAYMVGQAVREQDDKDAERAVPVINGQQVSEGMRAVWEAIPDKGWIEAKNLVGKVQYDVRSIGSALQKLASVGLLERDAGIPNPSYRKPRKG